MANPLFQKFGGRQNTAVPPKNIFQQLKTVQKDKGAILDILLQNGKITQSQYSDLQQYKNNPQQIVQYLIQNGNAGQIQQAQQFASMMGR